MSTTDTSVPSTQKVTISSILLGLRDLVSRFFSVSTLFVAFKYLAFIGFSVVSILLSVNMFYRLSSQPLEQTVLVAVAITFEFFKIFSIVRGNTLWRLKLKSQAVRAYSLYTVLALVSIMASYGFTLTVINRGIEAQSVSAVAIQIEASQKAQKSYQATLDSYATLIQTNTDRLKTLPPDFTTAAKSLSDSIAKIQAQSVTLQAQLTNEQAHEAELRIQAAESAAAQTTSVSMFKLMASGLVWLIPSLTESSLMLGLLLVISVLIEVGIISSSPSIPIDQKHLKHFLDEMSQHKAEELLAVAQGKKRKEMAVRRLSFAGRVAQRWMDWKMDVKNVLSSDKVPPTPAPAEEKKKPTTIVPDERTTVGSVPIRKPVPPHIEQPVAQPVLVPAAIAPVEEPVVVEEVVHKDATFPESERAVPVRPAPAIVSVGDQQHKVVDLPRTSTTPPTQVAEAKTYRFGKTTEAVKDMFVNFVNGLFENSTTTGALAEPAMAAAGAGIAPSLATTFTNRLLEIKGSSGNSLISKKEDGKLYPNYTREYIISYSTAEPSKERVR